VGLKTHAKCVLVVRREKSAEDGLRTYYTLARGTTIRRRRATTRTSGC
jgi:polyphosphate kinase